MSMEEAGVGSGGQPSNHRHKHVSPKGKMAAVLRVIKGEDARTVAEEIGVSAKRLSQWDATFVAGGLAALEKKVHRKTLLGGLAAKSSTILPWVGVLTLLLLTILLLVRFLNRDSGQ